MTESIMTQCIKRFIAFIYSNKETHVHNHLRDAYVRTNLANTINVFAAYKKEIGRLIRRNLIFKLSTPGLLKTIIGINCSSIIICFNWCVLCEVFFFSSSLLHRNFQFWKVQLCFLCFLCPLNLLCILYLINILQ